MNSPIFRSGILNSMAIILGLSLSISAIGQNSTLPPPVPGACHASTTNVKNNVHVQNGNASLGNYYNLVKCGLNWTQVSVKLGQRFNVSCCPSTVGMAQPATFAIAGLPACGVIEKAFLYASISGNGAAANISITNPAATNQVFPFPSIGTDMDKCWGYQATYTYRQDVTSIINGNGNYVMSGFPVDPSANTHLNDTDGATLIIIYSNPTQAYQGEIHIWDGCLVGIGNTNMMDVTSFNACSAGANAQAFIAVGDLQQINSSYVLNGGAPFQIGLVEDWYNFIQQATTVTAGQNTSHFEVQASGDCYNWMLSGLYFQTTTCTTCTFTPSNITFANTSTPAACGVNNGSATSNPSGGVGPYTYQWNTSPPQTTQTATGLGQGTYICTVSDATGCNTAVDTVIVGAVGGTTVTAITTPVLCNGGATGSATATAQTGVGPYNYMWTPSAQTNATATGLAAGTYTCLQTDASGCTDTAIVVVTQPPALASLTASTNVLCNGNNSATATVTPSGGVGNYTFAWTPSGGTTANATGLAAGNYSCTITDANGCTIQKTFTITQPPVLAISSAFNPADCGIPNGNANATVTGGNGPYTYSWSTTPAQTAASATGLANGNYTVYVTDANGCTSSLPIVVIDANDPVANFSVDPTVQPISSPYFNFTDLSLNASSWTWYFGDPNDTTVSYAQNPMHQYSDTGTFCITLIISNTVCTDTIVNCIVVQPEIAIFIPNAFTPNGDGHNDIFMPVGEFIGDFQMWIFDRWGNNIFKTNSTSVGWDGRANGGSVIAQEDVYEWVIHCSDPQGRKHKYVGHVSLVK